MLSDKLVQNRWLADPKSERAACGTGLLAHLDARPSHALVRDALSTVARLAHRGAVAADARTGDGAGILTQIPYDLFARELTRLGLTPPAQGDLAVGMFFLPRVDHAARVRAQEIISSALRAQGLGLLTWREVPIDLDALGEHARNTRPHISQALIARGPQSGAGETLERGLYLVRKEVERRARAEHLSPFYVPSLSSRTIVYKGLFVAPQLAPFYADLRDPAYRSALALFHQRYSTNTFPTWERAQPFRFLCHNGEINTLQGNLAWMRAREPFLHSPLWGEANDQLSPVIDTDGSDSAMLDNALELLALSGRETPHAMMMLIPEAWEKVPDMPEPVRAFYNYHATLMEPWDGPAAIAFSDGNIVGMTLDRNGLRPARYLVTDDGLIVAASEAGALEVDPERVIQKGKLGPGQMIVADLNAHKLWQNDELKNDYAARFPYRQWVDQQVRRLYKGRGGDAGVDGEMPQSACQPPKHPMKQLQAAFGYTTEDLFAVLKPMAENSAEAIGSMGDDTPHAVLSEFNRPLYHYFKQRFAQVTNPPMDPLRESLVMSLRVLLGARANILSAGEKGESPAPTLLLELENPLMTDAQLSELRARGAEFPNLTLNATLMLNADLERAVEYLCELAERAVDAGNAVLILSDRAVSATRAPIPMLLVVSAVHHHLLNVGKRWRTSLVAETGEARDLHHFACLIGYGADAVNPYLALASLAEFATHRQELTPALAEENFIHATEKGLYKIMSKMGISTLDAYHGAQIFETIGLDDALVERYFTGTPSPIGGIDLRDLQQTVLAHHAQAFRPDVAPERLALKHYGFFKHRKEGEYHAMNPEVVDALHAAVRTPGALNGNHAEAFAKYRAFSAQVHARPSTDLADHLDIRYRDPIPLEEVEPASSLVKRFSAAAMSHGSLSLEAHQTIAQALNRLGALSNSGEGGEDPARYGTLLNSPIKQVASARFGVTPAYLMAADELQIKIAQGSKPGEGGQLPGHKVTAEIAAIRHAQPGIALISPQPHHDIYSIEDLAQLIYDLKRVNPHAFISVKLVAQAGVGTIAAGVAKAHADVIQISGHSGGTGASPLSSIKHAGLAWELGLAETQQILVANDLRARVRLRVDGGLKTGRHVVIAALLGADEFSFGSAALVASGCIMARACHLNTCPVGIATQRPELRAKFPQVAEWVMAYFLFVAEETREYLAALGCRSLEEAVGRVEWLEFNSRARKPLSAPVPMPLTFSKAAVSL